MRLAKVLIPFLFTLCFFSLSYGEVAQQPGKLSGFKSLVEELQNHPEVSVLKSNNRLGELQVNQSIYSNLPGLSFNKNWFGPETDDLSRQTGGINARLNLFRGGKSLFDYHVSRSEEDRIKSESSQATNRIFKDAFRLYFQCLYQKERYAWSKKARELREKLLTVAQRRFKRGTLPESEVLKLSIDFRSAQNRENNNQKSNEQCQDRLAYWFKGPIQFEPVSATSLSGIRSFSAIKTERLKLHPQVLSKKAALAAAENDFYRSLGNYLPEVSLGYSESSVSVGQVIDRQWLVSLNWNIFDSGQSIVEMQKANVREDRARSSLETTEKQVLRDLEVAQAEYRQAVKALKLIESNSKDAKKLIRSTLRRFEMGAISANEISIDQGRIIETEFQLIDARSSLLENWIQVLFEAGEDVSSHIEKL